MMRKTNIVNRKQTVGFHEFFFYGLAKDKKYESRIKNCLTTIIMTDLFFHSNNQHSTLNRTGFDFSSIKYIEGCYKMKDLNDKFSITLPHYPSIE